MDTVREQANNPLWVGIASFVVGLIIGLVVLGWWLWPVQWTDAGPSDLRPEFQEIYLRMAIDSYTLNPDDAAAQQRIAEVGENAQDILIVIEGDPRTKDLGSIQVFLDFAGVEAVEELYSGIIQACKTYHVDLVGGDTTSSASGMFLSVTVVGEAGHDQVIYRHTAKENDLICVSGDLGGAYMGLLLLEREKAAFQGDPNMQPDLEGFDYILERQLKPEPRTDIIRLLKEAGVKPTAMIDISDGLGSEILHMCKGSGLGCRIYEEKIPIDPVTVNMAGTFKILPATAALNGGEDYELLFTIGQQDYDKVKAIPGISVIGHMTDTTQGAQMVATDGVLVEINAQGWNALKK